MNMKIRLCFLIFFKFASCNHHFWLVVFNYEYIYIYENFLSNFTRKRKKTLGNKSKIKVKGHSCHPRKNNPLKLKKEKTGKIMNKSNSEVKNVISCTRTNPFSFSRVTGSWFTFIRFPVNLNRMKTSTSFYRTSWAVPLH